MHFYRACPLHRDELQEVVTESGGEQFICPQGHQCRSFLTVADDGTVISRAWVNAIDVLVGEEVFNIQAIEPRTFCKNGHFEWVYNTKTKKWRCGGCKKTS